MASPILLWFRQDLRVHDHPALQAAVASDAPVVPVYLWAPEEEGSWAPGGASMWWLYHSLESLQEELARRGSRLVIRSGKTQQILKELIEETGARAVFWSRRYEPVAIDRDTRIRAALEKADVEVRTFSSTLLFEPWELEKADKKPYQVFTAFWKACGNLPDPGEPLSTPRNIPPLARHLRSEHLESLNLLPEVDWAGGFRKLWTPGESGALRSWKKFLKGPAAGYHKGRDIPGEAGTSRMSPHLHFGEISVRRMWHDLRNCIDARPGKGVVTSLECYLRELGWREFAYHLLYHFPRTPEDPLRRQFARFPWKRSSKALEAWQRGSTGYPVVDAGMRELWATGWMHNRVRMIVASFLVKHQLISWKDGARWFWDTLVDADLANNTLGWQWSAGCGADAAPYFRIFNPVRQGNKFDPEGVYVRRWIPELEKLPNRWIHEPWEAPDSVLEEAGVELGTTYPDPIVGHGEARTRALEAFAKMRRG